MSTATQTTFTEANIIGATFYRDGYAFRVMREYMPGIYEARGVSGEVVVALDEIIGGM